ncbi:dynamin family protein [Paenibacillus sp. JJ-223]|uniref:dynamin family protein n=1 Tax=Paenibacillus sp. JJ-223 TaxID=2905647 RepID=UPI001F181062|nr:dynamin family protein [Paenibacillus sp. JJ-223]CAH1221742.1 hypothetical protein PAECIP111890_05277 [Paenibacillus sp. JJ-223]
MTMKEMMRTHKEIASYLGDEGSLYLLDELERRRLRGEFYLPIVGQFSAGKSKFINALLDIHYLPTKGTEATAIPTFIAYGEEESAFIEYQNGSIVPIAPEGLASYQHTGDGSTAQDIKALHLQLNNPLLEQGLVIVDTPGFNTIVRSHEEVTLSVIRQAQFLIYVMSKSLTEYDAKFLQKIEEMGIELIFVRTKLDEIKPFEESLEELIQTENAKIYKYFEKKRLFFPVSSDAEALKQLEWKRRMEDMQQYINTQVNPCLKELWDASLGQRLLVLGRAFYRSLNEKQELLQRADSISAEKLQAQVSFLEQQVRLLDKSHYVRSNQIQTDLDPFLFKIKNDANRYKEECRVAFERGIPLHSGMEAMQEWTRSNALKRVEAYMNYIQEMFSIYNRQMIEQGFHGAQHLIQEISHQLEGGLDLNAPPFHLTLPDPERINQTHEHAVSRLHEELALLAELLQRSDEELRQYDVTMDEVQALAWELEHVVSEARREMEGMETYTPQTIYVEGNQSASEFMGKIGNIADWLTLFIPGKNAATAATKVEKISKITQIGKKLNVPAKTLQAATKTLDTVITKGNKLRQNMNKAKDVVVKVQGYQNLVRQTLPDEHAGLLDFITLEYWFKKAGTLFDTPPYHELDKVAEANYFNRKKELEQRHHQAIQKELKQLDELRLLRQKEERLKKEKEVQLRNQKLLEKQLEAERERAEKEAATTYARQLTGLFEEELSRVHAMLLVRLEQSYHRQVQAIIISATIEIQQKMASIQSDLQKLLEEKHDRTTDQHRAIQQVEAFMDYLEESGARLKGNVGCIQ